MNTALTLTAIGFIAVTVVFFWLLLQVLRNSLGDDAKGKKVYRTTTLAFVGWGIFLSAWSLSGMASRFDLFPLNMAPVLLIPFITTIVVTFSGRTRQLLQRTDHRSIIHLQVFRVFVEILLWALFVQELIPVQMTFEGRNFDIISGLTAPIAAIFLSRSRIGLVIWNLLCLGLLINIVTVAILSLPAPFRVFTNEPSSSIVATFPFILLPGMLVPLAYGLSFLSLRKIFIFQNETTPRSHPAPAGVMHSNKGD